MKRGGVARCGALALLEVAGETGRVSCSGKGGCRQMREAPAGGLSLDCFQKLLSGQHRVPGVPHTWHQVSGHQKIDAAGDDDDNPRQNPISCVTD